MNAFDHLPKAYADGFQNGVDHVMHDLNELLLDSKNFPTVQDRDVILRVYELLYKTYPEKL
jgi:hypothetical protein